MKELEYFLITYNLYISLKSVKKHITPQLQEPLSHAFQEYLQLLICILVELGWVYKSTISKGSDKQCLRFKGGGGGGWPPLLLAKICLPKWRDHRNVKSNDRSHNSRLIRF